MIAIRRFRITARVAVALMYAAGLALANEPGATLSRTIEGL